jgi:hypothetical protein
MTYKGYNTQLNQFRPLFVYPHNHPIIEAVFRKQIDTGISHESIGSMNQLVHTYCFSRKLKLPNHQFSDSFIKYLNTKLIDTAVGFDKLLEAYRNATEWEDEGLETVVSERLLASDLSKAQLSQLYTQASNSRDAWLVNETAKKLLLVADCLEDYKLLIDWSAAKWCYHENPIDLRVEVLKHANIRLKLRDYWLLEDYL